MILYSSEVDPLVITPNLKRFLIRDVPPCGGEICVQSSGRQSETQRISTTFTLEEAYVYPLKLITVTPPYEHTGTVKSWQQPLS